MPTPFRRLPWLPMLILVGMAAPAQAQQRSWMQASPRPEPATALRSTALQVKTAAAQPAPAVLQASPLPGPSTPWLPSASAPAGAPSATATTAVYYPLPAAAAATSGSVVPAAAQFPAGSPYAAAYLTAQQPTLAPPASAPIVDDPSAFLNGPMTSPVWTAPPQSALPSPAATGFPPFDPTMAYEPDPDWQGTANPVDGWFANVPRPTSWFFAASGLMLTRAVPNNVELAYSQTVPQQSILNTERAAMNQWVSGAEMRLGRSLGGFGAFEFVYWSTQTLANQLKIRDDNNQINSRLDFQNLFYQGTPLSDIFDNAHEQRLYRGDAFENIELNLLQQAMVVDPADRFGMTGFTGIRYFRFDEMLKYESVAAGAEFADNNAATQTNYWVLEKNRMLGWQLGGRWHARIGQRLRVFAMPRFGLYGNRIGQMQHACMILDDHSNKTNVTLMGQLDLGLTWQILPCCSAYCSYRAMAFSGVATSDDNIARTFTSPPALDSINSSGSLILHGWQMGGQFQF